MRIAFFSSKYPSPSRPEPGTFVRQFVRSMARQGHECDVVSPVSWLDRRLGSYPPRQAEEAVADGRTIRVHRPRIMTYSSLNLGWAHTGRWSNASFCQAAQAEVLGLPHRPDVVYGHFLYPAGYAAVRAARRAGVLSVVGVGEGEFWTLEAVGFRRAAEELKNATAFLAVSSDLAGKLTAQLGVPPAKIGVFPNGIDAALFHPRDRAEMCRKLGLPADTFNIGFAGPFVAKKGFPELIQAVKGLPEVCLVLLGRGEHPPGDSQTAFCGTVPHAEIADYMAACDVFVLPTRIEGSCNSVIEAMACGLPIVTSSGRHMDDIVDSDVAIRVDPGDVAALQATILALQRDPERRARMAAACLRKARDFDIDERARRVTAWLESLA